MCFEILLWLATVSFGLVVTHLYVNFAIGQSLLWGLSFSKFSLFYLVNKIEDESTLLSGG